MKQLVFSLLLLCFLGGYSQQGANNLNFEQWTTIFGEEIPSGFVGFYISKNSTTQQEGSFAMHLETDNSNQILNLKPGIAAIGTLNGLTGINQGEAYSGGKPAKFEGFLKYNIPSTDTGLVVVEFTRWTGTETKTVGNLTTFIQGNVSNWTCFDYDIYWDPTDTNNPDTITVLFASSGNISEIPGFDYGINSVGSSMDVDNWCFDCGVCASSTKETVNIRKTSIYPQPAINEINFVVPQKYTEITMYDIDGKKIKTIPYKGNSFTISTNGLKAGIYFYEIKNSSQVIDSGKISLIK